MKVTKTVSNLLNGMEVIGWMFRSKDRGVAEKAPDSRSNLSHGYQVLFELLGMIKKNRIIS